jgi:16S rRNA (cytosine967-C5)-methyltransferase
LFLSGFPLEKRKRRNPRRVALDILLEVERKELPLDLIIERDFERQTGLKELDYAFITEAVYGTLRWKGRIDWIIGRSSRIRPEKLERFVLNLLRLGLYQILFMDKVPASAAVNESVEMTKAWGREGAAGFVNAVLRAISDRRVEIDVPRSKDPFSISIRHSHPLWLVERWTRELGIDETIELCTTNNEVPPLCLRANTLRTTRDQLLAEIREEVAEAAATSFRLRGLSSIPPCQCPGFPVFRRDGFRFRTNPPNWWDTSWIPSRDSGCWTAVLHLGGRQPTLPTSWATRGGSMQWM